MWMAVTKTTVTEVRYFVCVRVCVCARMPASKRMARMTVKMLRRIFT